MRPPHGVLSLRRMLLFLAALALLMPATPQRAQAGRTHTVRDGETLWHIAGETVGDPTLWPALYLANRDQIKDPSRVYPGQQLAIPEIDPERAAELRREAKALTSQ